MFLYQHSWDFIFCIFNLKRMFSSILFSLSAFIFFFPVHNDEEGGDDENRLDNNGYIIFSYHHNFYYKSERFYFVRSLWRQ